MIKKLLLNKKTISDNILFLIMLLLSCMVIFMAFGEMDDNFLTQELLEFNHHSQNTRYKNHYDTENVNFEELEVLMNSSIKTYMDYRAITHKNSTQWDMIYNQKLFKITIDGYLITDDGYYAVALGRYFGDLGSKYIIVLDTGIEIPIYKLDAKADNHTDYHNYYGINAGDIIEFIIDGTKMDYAKGSNGYIYNGNFNNCEMFNGKIERIIIIEKRN